MIVIIAGDDHQLQPNGEVQSVAVPVTLRNVKNMYISIAPKDDKSKYIRQPNLSGFITPDFYTSEISKTYNLYNSKLKTVIKPNKYQLKITEEHTQMYG